MDNSGPAFPVPLAVSPSGDVYSADQLAIGSGGMSLRDWFAGQALAGLTVGPDDIDEKRCANFAYRMADAMLKARGES